MAVIEGTDRLKVAVAEYDFAVEGGAVGTIPLRSGVSALGAAVPPGSVVTSGYIEVDTPLASGGAATVALTLESAGDVQAAAVVTGAPWNTAGRKAVTAFAKPTVVRSVSAVVAVAPLTAGKFRVVLFYR